MGLDMFLERKKMAYWHGRESWNEENQNPHGLPDGIFFESSEVTQCVAHWRKANQIHSYFVNTIGYGKDDCEPIHVEKENIEKLLKICKILLNLLSETVNDPELYEKIVSMGVVWNAPAELENFCKEMLPTQDGFFFGDTRYNESYFYDLKSTMEMLSVVFEKWDDEWEYKYVASW